MTYLPTLRKARARREKAERELHASLENLYVAIVKARAAGASMQAIGDELGISRQAVHEFLNKSATQGRVK